jgi:hypothetical protein
VRVIVGHVPRHDAAAEPKTVVLVGGVVGWHAEIFCGPPKFGRSNNEGNGVLFEYWRIDGH